MVEKSDDGWTGLNRDFEFNSTWYTPLHWYRML